MRPAALRALVAASLSTGPLLAGCATNGFPEVDNARWLGAGGVPKIDRVRDIGTRTPPAAGKLTPDGDGVASPGEFLLIEGSGFGKSPLVKIGGRVAEIAAHTANGGVIVKVPGGIEPGAAAVEVGVGESRAKASFPLRRLGAVLRGAELRGFELSASGEAKPIGAPIPLPGARSLRLSPDGGCAYVVTGAKMWVIDLAAAGGPKVAASRDVAVENIIAVVAAERAPLVFVVGDAAVQAFETTDARNPARYDAAPLPPEAKGATGADLDPDGKRLALLNPDGNKLVVANVSRRDKTKLVETVALVPDLRVPFARDARFAGDGETIWAIAGDGPGSVQDGTQPTRVIAVRLTWPEGDEGARAGEPQVALWRSSMINGAGAPLRLSMIHGRATESGATIRMPPEKTIVQFSTVDRSLLGLAGASGAPGAIDQSDATGEGGRLLDLPFVLGQARYTSDNARMVGAAVREANGAREFGVAVIGVERPAQARFFPMGAATADDWKAPFAAGEVDVQP